MRFFVLIVSVLAAQMAWSMDRPLPLFSTADLTPYWPSVEGETVSPARVTEFQALDQNGNLLSEKNFDQQLSLVNFFFVDCTSLCPMMMASVQKFQKTVLASSQGLKIYSFSIHPEKDSPHRLREYSRSRHMDLKNWTLVTGNKKQVYHVGKEMFQADGSVGEEKGPDSFIHTKNIYLVDQQRRIRGIYNTEDSAAMRLLEKDIALLRTQG